MRTWDVERVAAAAGASIVGPRSAPSASAERSGAASVDSSGGSGPGASRAVIDSRVVGAEDLFIGLRGQSVDGGEHAVEALHAGAWGVLVTPQHAAAALAGAEQAPGAGAILAHEDPLAGLQALAGA
ncbi:MAG TPA: hypothetical protein VN817_00455, partial [Solirubrobacteraceae bacterium]|nr:hypothetical protein [Solirubrobacteraceae bacterium]